MCTLNWFAERLSMSGNIEALKIKDGELISTSFVTVVFVSVYSQTGYKMLISKLFQ